MPRSGPDRPVKSLLPLKDSCWRPNSKGLDVRTHPPARSPPGLTQDPQGGGKSLSSFRGEEPARADGRPRGGIRSRGAGRDPTLVALRPAQEVVEGQQG